MQERDKAPFIDDFPGDFESLPDLYDIELNIEAQFENEWYSDFLDSFISP